MSRSASSPLLLLSLFVLWPPLLGVGCGDGSELPAEARPAGAACEAAQQCASGICVGGGQCPDGRGYRSFCAGEPCQQGDCPIGWKCIRLERQGERVEVCVATGLCP